MLLNAQGGRALYLNNFGADISEGTSLAPLLNSYDWIVQVARFLELSNLFV